MFYGDGMFYSEAMDLFQKAGHTIASSEVWQRQKNVSRANSNAPSLATEGETGFIQKASRRSAE